MQQLENQREKDFEVIIVDQSFKRFDDLNKFVNLDLVYLFTSDRGAAKARNKGAKLARGRYLAFIDDDCIPDSDWIYNANKYFKCDSVVGIEGIIKSNKLNNPNYRTVTNVGIEGIAFMTANFFVKRSVFLMENGFDERFDNPHFREDTDFGWRALEYGEIPYAKDVSVFHPPHKRTIARESTEERATFFVKDPLLLMKHPERYINLYLNEKHYIHSADFWIYFKQGIELHNIDKDIIRQFLLNPSVEKTYIPKGILLLVMR